jgi:hypothetical protein
LLSLLTIQKYIKSEELYFGFSKNSDHMIIQYKNKELSVYSSEEIIKHYENNTDTIRKKYDDKY